ncbi:hypothetical protein [Bradyrhizobium sp. BR 10289]|nr:hypothetical protein [Bradyrhizobium sp. BR 10289]MBW7968118.1 hypothetical protein [Bradyrhizobium sp. BR 10289]
MSDAAKQEQPTEGGSYTRQPNGSLVRNEEKPAVKEPKAAKPKKEN